MANNDKDPPGGAPPPSAGSLGGEDRFSQALQSRWDPAKISSFMKASSGDRAQRLDMSQRSRFEKRLGVDLGHARVFSGELAEEITRAHNAEALTIGDTGMILMRPSATYAPGTAAGTALLAHELTHVAQARPTTVSRKKTATDLAQEDESEEEAEEHEAEVHAEETGKKGSESAWKTQADKGESERARLERIKDKVLELMEEDEWMHYLRGGGGAAHHK
jgi:uncharacterized protein DUF4157